MPMSEDERRQLREAEAELAGQRQMAKLARRLVIGTLLVVGVALIAVQVYGHLREHRLTQGRHPHPPSR